jgi:signal transduction histidine kinase
LSITAVPSARGIRIDVTDTGPGIPPHIIDRAFEPWVTTKPLGEGSGIGLAIVRDVLRAHGGTVSAYNGDTGATFVLDLPADQAAHEVQTQP